MGQRASPASMLGLLRVNFPGTSHVGCEQHRTKNAQKAWKSAGRRSRQFWQQLSFPLLLPSPPSGAAGNYLLKRRPRSHLFAVNNPRHRSAFIKPFPSLFYPGSSHSSLHYFLHVSKHSRKICLIMFLTSYIPGLSQLPFYFLFKI